MANDESKSNEVYELEQQIAFLRVQLGKQMEENKMLREGSLRDGVSSHGESSSKSKRHDRLDFKVEVPEFDGSLNVEDYLDWIHTVERVFELKDCSDELKVKYVALKLRKHASIWWTNLQKKRVAKGKEKIRSWDKMKSKLQSKFLPQSYVHDNYYKLQKLVQGSKSVEEYTREFEHLLWRCDLKEKEPQVLVRYLIGLNDWIRHIVELHSYESLDELSNLAMKVERQRKERAKEPQRPYTPLPYSQTQSKAPQNQPPSSLKPYAKPTLNQPQNPPSKTQVQEPRTLAPRRCFRCQGLGHYASECPNKRVVSLVDYQSALYVEPEYEKEEEVRVDAKDEEDVVEEYVEEPDEGELLVVERALNITNVPIDQLQREAIFRSRCTIQGRVCSLIIDGGSCTNAASTTMVKKLQMEISPHPTPYTIQWLNLGQGIRVDQRVLVSLSIGKNYQDSLWCDIVPMDTCHALLGRPWLYDRHVIHDGRANTYTLIINQKRISLAPLDPPSRQKEKRHIVSIMKMEYQGHEEYKDPILTHW